MNCSEFDRRLQQQLDERLQPELDSRLQGHATECDECRVKLGAWQRIAFVLPNAPDTGLAVAARKTRSRFRRVMPIAATLAATVMLVFLVSREDPDSSVTVVAQVEPDGVAVASSDIDPSQWWHTVQDRDWMQQTMPAVRSVRDGVAPLGRSLLQAVTILTTGSGGGDRPS